MLTIARITWKEILSRKVLVVTAVLSLLFLALYWYICYRSFHTKTYDIGFQTNALEQYTVSATMVAIGLYLTNFMVAFLSIFSTIGTISSELESGVLLSVMARPIARWRIYLGKWIGYAAWSILFALILYWAILLVAHFTTGFILHGADDVRGCLVMILIPLVLVTLSMFASIYLSPLTGGIALTILFGIGLIGGFLENIPGINQSLSSTGFTIGLFIPTDPAYHRMMFDVLSGNMLALSLLASGSSSPSGAFMIYIVCYIAACLSFGVYRFSRRDIT
ncbi:ABC transporter permease [Alicyclobacillus dauci]|uniref:ABC transporter permease n=1 Tax=Alicyclobacillus dauci TaxID=1475485 RepID=A0ABY6Z1G1_9BACL|nr:ABC transporter permease [Alicyclobacillus dauci]WAH36720.1 ABC transporter permease [Alicyclobacillus dauci]